MKFRVGKKKGDTLVEVMFAIGIFSLVAIAITSLMMSGSSSMQTSLETTMARNEIDAQAEALRFLHQAYLAEKAEGIPISEQKYKSVWDRIDTWAEAKKNRRTTALLDYHPLTCEELYNTGSGASSLFNQNAFIVNTMALGNTGTEMLFSVNDTGSSTLFRQADVYPRVYYGASNSLTSRNYAFQGAEGVYIVPVKDPGSTTLSENKHTNATRQAYYDFYIRSCWYGYGKKTPTTISTLIRLYDPNVEVDNNISMEYVLTYDPNGGNCDSGDMDCPRQDVHKGGASYTFSILPNSTLNRGGLEPYGWNTTGYCNNTPIYKNNASYPMNGTIQLFYDAPFKTLKAIWDCQYTLKYKGSTADDEIASGFPANVSLIGRWDNYQPKLAAAPTMHGHTFQGWKCTGNSSNVPGGYQGDLVSFSKDRTTITCTAQWSKVNTYNYSVTYNVNGGSFSGSSNVDEIKESLSPEEHFVVRGGSQYSRTNYTFKGWNTKADGTGTSYDAEDDLKLTNSTPSSTASVTLYAKWEALVPPSTIWKIEASMNGDYDSNLVTNYSDSNSTSYNMNYVSSLKIDRNSNTWSSSGDIRSSGSEVMIFPVYSGSTYKYQLRNFNSSAYSVTVYVYKLQGGVYVVQDGRTYYFSHSNYQDILKIENGTLTWLW